nr:hypothetical protein [Mycobacterium sp. UM_NZ2]
MKRLWRILTAPQRALARAPQWVPTAAAATVGVLAAAGMAVTVKEAGYRQGFVPGQSAGYAEGYSAGFSAGERRQQRRALRAVEVDELPAGVDREAAAAAEERGQAYAYLSARPEAGCTVMVRLPFPILVGIPDETTAVGLPLDVRYWPCDTPVKMRLPGYKPPTVADRPMRWERAIIGGDLFAYRVGDTIRLNTDRCSGFTIPLPVPAGGVAVPETAPSVSRSSVCGNKPR